MLTNSLDTIVKNGVVSAIIYHVFAARWLGHGRAIEAYLILVCGTYAAILLIHPSSAADSPATLDLYWSGNSQFVAMIFVAKALTSGTGLVLNIVNLPGSRFFRISGACLGSVIWAWYVAKFSLVGEPATLGMVFAAVSFLVSIRIMGMAYANLPRPGAPGAL